MSRLSQCLLSCSLLLAASCCPRSRLVGTWNAADEAQRGPIAVVSFCPDHTFTAGADYAGQTRAASGCWCCCTRCGKLTICTKDGKRSYDVALSKNGAKLTVTHEGKDYHMVRMKPYRGKCGG